MRPLTVVEARYPDSVAPCQAHSGNEVDVWSILPRHVCIAGDSDFTPSQLIVMSSSVTLPTEMKLRKLLLTPQLTPFEEKTRFSESSLSITHTKFLYTTTILYSYK
ncbi:hypothetical protein J6590_069900 [Homalodisca vitripennis]|nr:hypothetical protein J6590_069900 [Homalodisca vitripennis]